MSSRSMRRSVCRALAACFSLASLRNLRPILSLSRDLRRAFLTPFSIHARWRPRPRLQRRLAIRVVVVRLPRGLTCHRALVEIGVVPAAIDRDALQAAVDLDDRRHGAREELAVMADDHHAGGQTVDELLEPVEPVDVEVVGRLVQQIEVVAREQQRRESDAGGLTAGQRRRREVEVDGQSRSAATTGSRSSRSAPPMASQDSSASPYPSSEPPEPRASAADSIDAVAAATPVRLASTSRTDSPARLSLSCSRNPMCDDRGDTSTDPASACEVTGEDPQQRRLADAVRTHETDDVAGTHGQVEAGEQDSVAPAHREATGDQDCAHGVETLRDEDRPPRISGLDGDS